jgi:hypothetical protein
MNTQTAQQSTTRSRELSSPATRIKRIGETTPKHTQRQMSDGTMNHPKKEADFL